MSILKNIELVSNNTSTDYDIGAEAQNIEVSYDADGNIIEDISGATVDHVEGLSVTLKKPRMPLNPTAQEINNFNVGSFWLEIPPLPYLTFSSDSAFTLSVGTPNWDGTLEYSTDTSTWTTWDGSELSGTDSQSIYLRGTNNTVIIGQSNDIYKWSFTGKYITGNIENLLDYQTVANGQHPVMGSYCYTRMFKQCASLVNIPTILPATTLAEKCYQSMFNGCTSLVNTPELPATTLADSCYAYMFNGCTSLINTPELPATTLATYCYENMFNGCTSLVNVSELPATTLPNCCYKDMFYGCTSLTTPPALPATTLTTSCYYRMFYNCTSLTTVPELPAITLAISCYRSMFSNCSSIKLSTTQTGNYQYAYIIPSSGTGTTTTNALTDMFANTGGTFTGTPTINTPYYTDHEPV